MEFKELQDLFISRGYTLGCVESFTGGLFAKEVTSIPGASKYFKGGFVTYATEEKNRLLGISWNLIDRVGVVSQEVAMEMACHGGELLGTTYCVSFTGNAGPDSMEGKPVGEIYIGIYGRKLCRVHKFVLNGSREEIQRKAVFTALSMIKQMILQENLTN